MSSRRSTRRDLTRPAAAGAPLRPCAARAVRARLRSADGFTLPEVMMASLVLVIGALALVALVDAANATTVKTRSREGGTNLAREIVENAKAISYDDSTPLRIAPALQARPGLADSAAGGDYTVVRRNVEYTIAATVCSLDDPNDGLGSHATTPSDGVPFCSASGAGGAADSTPNDYRQVTATVTWGGGGPSRTVTQSSFVMPPSGSDLPVITSLTASTGTTAITTNIASVGFTATTSSVPAGVAWSQDGTQKGDATGSNTSWSFTWPISGLVDGDYVVGARARTGGGTYGLERTQTMRLNRFVPAAPRNFVAGKNGTTVDSEWLANTERDIEGYRVYRQQTSPTLGAATQVNCGTVGTPVYLTTQPKCTDAAPLVDPGVTFVGSTSATSEASTIAVGKPSGVTTGDILIATVASSTGSVFTSAPSGWTSLLDSVPTNGGQGLRNATYYRLVPSGTEPTSYTWTVGSSRSTSASISAWRGVDSTTTGGDFSEQNGSNVSGATETAPNVFTTVIDATVIRTFAHRGPASMTLTTPAGTTLRSSNRSAATVHSQVSEVVANPGNAGTRTSTCATSCTQWGAQTIALRPKSAFAVNYWAVAVDRDPAGALRPGAPSNVINAYAVNNPPTAPSGLSAATAADGSNVISWTTQGTDPNTGDSVAFYRVYRDGVKIDRTGLGTDTSWTDPRPPAGTHTYYLKAVDTHLAESPASASVTR